MTTLSKYRLYLMDLPFEIRLHVYQDVLDASRIHKPRLMIYCGWCYNLTSTCSQVRYEFLSLIVGNRMYHKNVEMFSDWARSSPLAMQKIVQSLGFTFSRAFYKIADKLPRHLAGSCDLHPQLKVILERRHVQSTMLLLHNDSESQLALEEIASFWEALHLFPNVQKIWVHASDLDDYSSNPPTLRYENQANLIMEIISFAFPHVLSYEAHVDLLPLSQLKRFPELRHLHFSGYSKTSPEDALSILQSLKHLDSITIYQFTEEPPQSLWSAPNLMPLHSQHLVMTPEIIAQLNPLRDVIITSDTDTIHTSRWHVVPLTKLMMEALLAHSQSLRSLKITQRYTNPQLESDVLQILDFAHGSPIPHVYLDLTLPSSLGLSIDPKHFLPRTMGKRMDGRTSPAYLRVGTGKYIPSERELEWRQKTYAPRPGSSMPVQVPGTSIYLPLDSFMEHSEAW